MEIKIVNKSKHQLPAYSTSMSAGMDLRANIDGEMVLKPGQRALMKTGLFLEIPQGYEAPIRPQSGLPINKGITVLNSPGTIDSDYRGEVCIILINFSEQEFIIKDGERICQMVIAKHERAEWIAVDTLIDTERGDRGFGHTGKE